MIPYPYPSSCSLLPCSLMYTQQNGHVELLHTLGSIYWLHHHSRHIPSHDNKDHEIIECFLEKIGCKLLAHIWSVYNINKNFRWQGDVLRLLFFSKTIIISVNNFSQISESEKRLFDEKMLTFPKYQSECIIGKIVIVKYLYSWASGYKVKEGWVYTSGTLHYFAMN